MLPRTRPPCRRENEHRTRESEIDQSETGGCAKRGPQIFRKLSISFLPHEGMATTEKDWYKRLFLTGICATPKCHDAVYEHEPVRSGPQRA